MNPNDKQGACTFKLYRKCNETAEHADAKAQIITPLYLLEGKLKCINRRREEERCKILQFHHDIQQLSNHGEKKLTTPPLKECCIGRKNKCAHLARNQIN